MAEKQQLIKMVRDLQSGNKDMAAVLYEAYYRDLHYYILKRVNDPEKAEALTKETFIEIFDTMSSSLKDAKHFVEWSRQLADRRCEEYRRARRALLSGKVGSAVLDSVEKERKELHPDETENDEVYLIETKRRVGVKTGAKMVESIARKVIVGVVAALILTMIKESGIDWLYVGGVFESAEEESTTQSENTENTEEDTFVDDTEQIESTAVQTEAESKGEEPSSVVGTESESATPEETENQPTEPEETESQSTTPEETEGEPTIPEATESEPTTPEETKPEPTTQAVVMPEETEPEETVPEKPIEEMVSFMLGNGYWMVRDVGTWIKTDIVIPATFEGLPIEGISSEAFMYNHGVTSVLLSEGIHTIWANAFADCINLERINLPDSIHFIGSGAFRECNKLTDLVLPQNLSEICNDTFANCSKITQITLPAGISSIGAQAFSECNGLTEITIPAGVKRIAANAFYRCYNLDKIVVEEANTIYYSEANCLISKSGKKLVLCGNKSVIPMDGSINSIGDYACVNCRDWTEVVIPEGVTQIGDQSFAWLLNLQKITIPASVTSIGERAFHGDSKLGTFIYGGTMEQWKAIEKGNEWAMGSGFYIVYCTDGQITQREDVH